MEFKDYYQILGIKPDADAKTIKTAYRKLARKFHPDMNPDESAETKFKEVAEAYQVLKNDQRRAEFDELRQYGAQSNEGFRPPPGWQASRDAGNQADAQFDGDYSDFFNSIFGSQGQSFNQSRRARGQDIELEMPIYLEETLTECQKTVEFVIPADGYTHTPSAKKRLKVKVPQGVMDGERIRLKGQGAQGHKGGLAGDLYLHIRVVPHPLFDVQGHNITITVPLSPWEAALGTKISVPTLAGKVNLMIPSDSQSGDKLRLKGKGLKTRTFTGDMFAVINVTMPTKTSKQAKQLWQKLATCEHFDPRREWSTRS